jgi:hypothetical protein
MKRKAMVVGMAVVAAMPGWAAAKGTGKVAGQPQSYYGGTDAPVPLQTVEIISEPPAVIGVGKIEAYQGKAASLLSQVKVILRSGNYGARARPTADSTRWAMEMLEAGQAGYGASEVQLHQIEPVGVAVRYTF